MSTIAKCSLAVGFAIVLTSIDPHVALAQRRGGGGGGGGRAAAPAQHMSAPSRPAQPARPAPQAARPASPSGGFDLHEDTAPQPRQPTPNRAAPPAAATHTVSRPVDNHQTVTRTANRPASQAHAAQGRRPALIGNLGYGGQRGSHRVLADPRYHGNAWGWNRGVTWYPAPSYYGGGFWGPFALGAAIAAFGAIDYDDGTYDSYQVEPDSPGAELLQNYQLTQEQCGPPNLVVIFGPDNSVICADPNDLVAAGDYQLDPSDLTIVSVDS